MRGFLFAIVALLLFGGVAGIAYQAGAASVAGAGAAAAGYPYYWHPFFFGFPFFGLLFPLLFFFLIFGLARALFWGGYGRPWGGRGDRRRMLEEWHREMHEQPGQRTEQS
jgi:hypothetical protein